MAQAHLGFPSSSLSLIATDGGAVRRLARPLAGLASVPSNGFSRSASSFRNGSPLVISKKSTQRRHQVKAFSMPIRCEQSTKESGGLDIWLGRFAMVGFAPAITIEIVTGKGLLEEWWEFCWPSSYSSRHLKIKQPRYGQLPFSEESSLCRICFLAWGKC